MPVAPDAPALIVPSWEPRFVICDFVLSIGDRLIARFSRMLLCAAGTESSNTAASTSDGAAGPVAPVGAAGPAGPPIVDAAPIGPVGPLGPLSLLSPPISLRPSSLNLMSAMPYLFA